MDLDYYTYLGAALKVLYIRMDGDPIPHYSYLMYVYDLGELDFMGSPPFLTANESVHIKQRN